MTKLLERAIAKLQKLSSAQQDEMATRILMELEDEEAWERCFEMTTEEQWEKLAAKVRQDIAAGDVAPLDDVLSEEM